MEENLHEVRRDIENTRAALGQKIGRLAEKIETTKNTTLNPVYHVRTRPWPTLGVAVGAGCLLGRFFRSHAGRRNRAPARPSLAREMMRNAGPSAANVMGLVVADFLRDFIHERRKRRQTPR